MLPLPLYRFNVEGKQSTLLCLEFITTLQLLKCLNQNLMQLVFFHKCARASIDSNISDNGHTSSLFVDRGGKKSHIPQRAYLLPRQIQHVSG